MFDNGVMYDTPNRELSIVGRFLSPDPAGVGWNQYAYPTNPNSFIDPSGLGSCPPGQRNIGGKCWGSGGVGCTDRMNPNPTCKNSPTNPGGSDDPFALISQGYWQATNDGGSIWVQTPIFIIYPPDIFTGGNTDTATTPENNGVTATIKAGPPNAKKDFCSHQADLAAANSVLPGLANAIQGDYRPIAGTAASSAVQTYAMDTAVGSTWFLLKVRSWTGVPMSVSTNVLRIAGYLGTAYTAYGALKAAQTEYAACMQ